MISFGAKKLGYRLPTEWEKQVATWLIWPHNADTWMSGTLPQAQKEYAAFVAVITKSQEARILINDIAQVDRIENLLKSEGADLSKVKFFLKKTNDSWMRDCGPDFLVHPEKEKLILNWEYNAWGEKYPPFDDDNCVPEFIAENLALKSIRTDIVLEGGSFEVNEEGVLLTTESCLLNPNRNPFYDQDLLTEVLKKYLGVDRVVWLIEGITGDDTDGHIDDFCRFAPNKKILLSQTEDQHHPDYAVLKKAKERLQNELGDYEIIELPIPSPLSFEGEDLPVSYANYCLTNDHVIVPVFGQATDELAIKVLEECFPDREVVGVRANTLLIGLGGLHCLSKHEPAI